ncbi:hypothetical protein [Pediococcus pentosaceus]|uniref:hypothetical protein n=1 Tax=Pediococcus pentosaceus TaxID=1255 RepID=UPI0023802959|nr:hypothetical protein [Pediococcus pentosaceus]MDE3751862.1 hypothetical protein [Pediococcus pentosaceus]
MVELTKEVEIYLFNHNIGTLDIRVTDRGWVYIKTNAEQPMFRYSIKSPELLQHDLGNNQWNDIWLGVRREQTALF